MKLSRIQIDSFGHWRNLDLALKPDGLSLLFGPNEAGKTTLLRFIRGVLYGFPLSEMNAPENPDEIQGGSLDLQSNGRHCRIVRQKPPGVFPNLSLTGWDRAVPTEEALGDILAGTSRNVFQNVFAIGLQELQQLASLQSDDVAKRLYGLSLGADGRQLLAALQSTQSAKRQLLDIEANSGTISHLIRRDSDGDASDQGPAMQREEYDHFLRERQKLNAEIRELQSRQSGMQSQLRGHKFLQRIFGPWRQVGEYRAQLDAIPNLADFPADGVERLRQIETDIASENRCRQTLQNEIETREARRNAILSKAVERKHLAALRKSVRQRQRIKRIIDERDAARNEMTSIQQDLQEFSRKHDSDWVESRIEDADCSPTAQSLLLQAARTFQAAGVRRGRCRRLLKKATQSHRKLATAIERKTAAADGQTVEKQSQRISRLEEYRRLQNRINEAHRRQRELRTANDPHKEFTTIPKWFSRILWFFGIVGGLVAISGLLTTFTLNAWSGLILSLAGFSGLGIAWGLKTHYEYSRQDHTSRGHAELQQLDHHLRSANQELQRLTLELNLAESTNVDEQFLAKEQSRLTDLKALQRKQRLADRQRQRLSKLRLRFSGIRQEYGRARQEWCEALVQVGIPETLRIDEAFDKWQLVYEVQQLYMKRKDAEARRDRRDRQYDRAVKRIEQTAARLEWALDKPFEPITLLDQWSRQLESVEESREECRKLKAEIGTRRREIAGYTERIRDLKRQQRALLAQVGAANREEFEQLATSLGQRTELQELLELAEEELRDVAATEPELAVVEDDLARHDPDENDECIRVLESELEDIAVDLETAHEKLGGIKRAITERESDRRGTQMRFRQARHEHEVVDNIEDWLANDLALQVLTAMRTRFERERQPAVLAVASRLLQQLTDDRYLRIWSPLGRRRICIDDLRGRTWNADDLSGGTREQVFLATRLALIDEFASHNIELPVILDDVLVNFDQTRTEAAVKTLIDFAKSGRQIIFLTCHQHIAEAFRSYNINPLTLPAPHRKHRIAG